MRLVFRCTRINMVDFILPRKSLLVYDYLSILYWYMWEVMDLETRKKLALAFNVPLDNVTYNYEDNSVAVEKYPFKYELGGKGGLSLYRLD